MYTSATVGRFYPRTDPEPDDPLYGFVGFREWITRVGRGTCEVERPTGPVLQQWPAMSTVLVHVAADRTIAISDSQGLDLAPDGTVIAAPRPKVFALGDVIVGFAGVDRAFTNDGAFDLGDHLAQLSRRHDEWTVPAAQGAVVDHLHQHADELKRLAAIHDLDQSDQFLDVVCAHSAGDKALVARVQLGVRQDIVAYDRDIVRPGTTWRAVLGFTPQVDLDAVTDQLYPYQRGGDELAAYMLLGPARDQAPRRDGHRTVDGPIHIWHQQPGDPIVHRTHPLTG